MLLKGAVREIYGDLVEEFLSLGLKELNKNALYFQHGSEAASVADLKIADQLYHYMVGGQTKPQVSRMSKKLHRVV